MVAVSLISFSRPAFAHDHARCGAPQLRTNGLCSTRPQPNFPAEYSFISVQSVGAALYCFVESGLLLGACDCAQKAFSFG